MELWRNPIYQKNLFTNCNIYDIICISNSINRGEYSMLKIKFKYRDKYSNWEWREQTCTVSSIEECKRIYNLGVDCDYEIISVEKITKEQ
jgi:hypothetical protein